MIGKTILQYEILKQIGEGGMGTVYKAKDTKLDRFVALKFLHSQLTATKEMKARFTQEAKAASALNHPNVCTIHDIQEFENQLFIVMEYIDGVSLRDKRENLSDKKILDIAIQAAEGLAAAHEKGIVHRDIKPENIMIRKDGIVQIMDFGLAKLHTDNNSSRLTKAGTTMGTIGYMSPEQVQGIDVDHRSDIFSLGVVLYEFFAGESPFKGIHEMAIMYEIVNVEAQPIVTLRKDINPKLDELILECLEKEKYERCQSAKELARNLRKLKKASTSDRTSRIYNVNTKVFQTQSGSRPASKSSGSITIDFGKIYSSKYLMWSLVGILSLAVLYFAMFNKQKQAIPITTTTSIISPVNFNIMKDNSQISHNAKYVVFVTPDSTGELILWLRPVNSTNTRELTKIKTNQTSGYLFPFWSYNDKFIYYFSIDKLKKLNVISGTEIDICDVTAGRGGTINKNGDIVFAPNPTGGLYLVSENGGTPREIVKVDSANSEESLRYPYFLPDGVHFLYTIQARFSGASSYDEVMVGSINSDTKDTVIQVSSNAQYSNGYLFFVRQSTLMCQAFDSDNFNLSDDVYTLSGNVSFDHPYIYASYSVSNTGNLIFQTRNEFIAKVILANDKGIKKEELFTKNNLNAANFSPDGTKIIYDKLDPDHINRNIWIYDINRKITTRVTFSSNLDQVPIWSNDGKNIAYASNKGKYWSIYIKKADGTGSDSLVYQSTQFIAPSDWSRDGKHILFWNVNPKTTSDIGIIDLNKNNTIHYILNTVFKESRGLFSNNMKWIMYESNESGKSQIYVQPYDGNGSRWQVSNNGRFTGGFTARWIDNDKAIIYVGQEKVFKVNVDASGQNFVVGKPELLFNMEDKNIIGLLDVTKDGKTFLGAVSKRRAVISPITYLQNWMGLINKKDN